MPGNVLDLSFAVESRYRPFRLIADTVGSTPRVSGAGLHLTPDVPQAPFCAVEASVDISAGRVLLGLATGGSHLFASYDADAGRVGIEHRVDGRTRLLRSRKAGWPARFRFGFALCENQVTVLVDTGDGWRPVITERRKVRARIDLRSAATLAEHRYAYEVRGGAGAGVTDVRWGLFGMAGLRDQHLVQHSDGTPYVRDGKVYLTATCAGLGFFQQAHWGVFTLDLARPERLEQVAQLFFRRDGLLLGDHAGQIVRDDGRWILLTSSWGDFDVSGVHVRHLVSSEDLLHGVHVLETETTPLPTVHGSWDPGLTRIDGRWHLGFVESPSQRPFRFHPALASGPVGAAWHEKLELVGAATGLLECEGPILAQVAGAWWFLASDRYSRTYPVYDLRMRLVGQLDAPYPTNIPHPQLVPLDDGGFLLVTFDGTPYGERVMGYGGHGDVIIMRSRPTG